MRNPALMKFLLQAVLIHMLLFGASGGAQSQGPDGQSRITMQDLAKLSEEGISDELIIAMVRAAEQVPALSPEDVIALKKAGVSVNVITAVVQKRSAMTGAPKEASTSKERNIRITASLHPQKRSWWRRGLRARRVDKTDISWGITAYRWEGRERLELAPSPNCPQDAYCAQWDRASGECKERVEAGSPQWKQNYGCYLANRMTEFGDEYEIFQVNLPERVSDAEIYVYFKDVENERFHWFTRSADGFSGEQVPGFVKLNLWGSDDINLDLHIRLFMSPSGYIQDFEISQCAVVNRDEDSLRRRVLADERRYCSIEKARL